MIFDEWPAATFARDPEPPEGPRIACHRSGCGRFRWIGYEEFLNYFLGNVLQCEACGNSMDIWESLKLAFVNQIPPIVLGIAGALNGTYNVLLQPGDQVLMDLTTVGVPSDARIINRQYSIANGYRVLEVTDRHHPGSRHLPVRYGLIALADPTQSADTPDVLMQVMFVEQESGSDPSGLFLLACELFIAGEPLGQVAVIAHSAVEVAMRSLVRMQFEKTGSTGLAASFAERMDVKHVVQLVVPSIAANLGFRSLPGHISGELEQLRRLRNEAAHTLSSPEFSAVAQHLAACTIALAWLDLLRMILSGQIVHSLS